MVRAMREQRRGLSIAMGPREVDAFLADQRTCRVATVGADGGPHVVPLWFVWDDTYLWLNSLVRSKRWSDVARHPRVAVVVDDGSEFWELRGVEITGLAEAVGEVPRGSEPDQRLARPEQMFARKYLGTDEFVPDGRHAWLRITTTKITSWDFRKNGQLRPA